LNTFALSCCIAARWLLAMQQLSAKVFKLSFEYSYIYSPKIAILQTTSKKLWKTLKPFLSTAKTSKCFIYLPINSLMTHAMKQ